MRPSLGISELDRVFEDSCDKSSCGRVCFEEGRADLSEQLEHLSRIVDGWSFSVPPSKEHPKTC